MNPYNDPAKPRCHAQIDGPKYGRLVSWRRYCRRRVRRYGDRCWLHTGRLVTSPWAGRPE